MLLQAAVFTGVVHEARDFRVLLRDKAAKNLVHGPRVNELTAKRVVAAGVGAWTRVISDEAGFVGFPGQSERRSVERWLLFLSHLHDGVIKEVVVGISASSRG